MQRHSSISGADRRANAGGSKAGSNVSPRNPRTAAPCFVHPCRYTVSGIFDRTPRYAALCRKPSACRCLDRAIFGMHCVMQCINVYASTRRRAAVWSRSSARESRLWEIKHWCGCRLPPGNSHKATLELAEVLLFSFRKVTIYLRAPPRYLRIGTHDFIEGHCPSP